MNKMGVIFIVVIALVIGYNLGKKESEPTHPQRYPVLIQEPSDIDMSEYEGNQDEIRLRLESEHEEKLQEITSRLEDAKDAAEQAKSAADNAAFQARMRWIETLRVEDMMHMNDADYAVDRAEESLNNVNDALSNIE
jgi:hypothetical protein